MLTFHEPSTEPAAWMTDGQLGAFPTIGAQVRARVTEAGDVEVGAFPVLDVDAVATLRGALRYWHANVTCRATCLVLGVHGTGPAAAWGPSFASHPERREASEVYLVHAVEDYLDTLA